MSAHTPGPWGASCAPFDMAVTAIVNGKQVDLMGARAVGSFGDEHESNIALAAAAPDMLEALELCLRVIGEADVTPGGGVTEEEIDAAYRKAKAAIAKAKGGAA